MWGRLLVTGVFPYDRHSSLSVLLQTNVVPLQEIINSNNHNAEEYVSITGPTVQVSCVTFIREDGGRLRMRKPVDLNICLRF